MFDKKKARSLINDLMACIGPDEDDDVGPATKSTTEKGMEYVEGNDDSAGDGGSEGATDMTPELPEAKTGSGVSKKKKLDIIAAKITGKMNKLGGSNS